MSDLIRRLREEPKSRERLNGLSSAATVAWHDACLEAADRIESDAAKIESLTSENTRIREELELCRASHIRLERLYNQALGKLGLPPFEQILASNTPPPSHKGED